MKDCKSCHRGIPDAAAHCVHCGAKQEASPSFIAAPTMAGHEPSRPAIEAVVRPGRAELPPRRVVGPHAGPGPGPHRPPAPHEQKTMAMDTRAPQGLGPPPAQPAPQPALAGADEPRGPAPMASPPAPAAGIGAGTELPMHIASDPGFFETLPAPQRPPVAQAFQVSGARPGPVPATPPSQAWRGTVRWLLAVGALLLLAGVAVPWSITGDELVFSWAALEEPGLLAKLTPLLLAGSGVIALLLAILPLPAALRGLLAGALGLGCANALTILGVVLLSSSMGTDLDAMAFLPIGLGVIASLTWVPGLLLRSAFRDSWLARMLVTVGALCVLAPLSIPRDGQVPIVAIGRGLIDAPTVEGALLAVLPVLAVSSLLVWIGRGRLFFALLAWAILLTPLSGPVAAIVAQEFDTALLLANLATSVHVPIAVLMWSLFCAYGFASLYARTRYQQ